MWAVDRMYNAISDLDLTKARVQGGVGTPGDAKAAEYSDEINSVKSLYSKKMKEIRVNQLMSADAKRARIQQVQAELNVKMALIEDQIERARKSSR
jgi:hypothetical protein